MSKVSTQVYMLDCKIWKLFRPHGNRRKRTKCNQFLCPKSDFFDFCNTMFLWSYLYQWCGFCWQGRMSWTGPSNMVELFHGSPFCHVFDNFSSTSTMPSTLTMVSICSLISLLWNKKKSQVIWTYSKKVTVQNIQVCTRWRRRLRRRRLRSP